ncbi:unnamed protein product [Amoebophrya sp. A120]|nr:unnamed protein product [Amoebophrya sp. A120]|eukprot:GSA120T00005123001.1
MFDTHSVFTDTMQRTMYMCGFRELRPMAMVECCGIAGINWRYGPTFQQFFQCCLLLFRSFQFPPSDFVRYQKRWCNRFNAEGHLDAQNGQNRAKGLETAGESELPSHLAAMMEAARGGGDTASSTTGFVSSAADNEGGGAGGQPAGGEVSRDQLQKDASGLLSKALMFAGSVGLRDAKIETPAVFRSHGVLKLVGSVSVEEVAQNPVNGCFGNPAVVRDLLLEEATLPETRNAMLTEFEAVIGDAMIEQARSMGYRIGDEQWRFTRDAENAAKAADSIKEDDGDESASSSTTAGGSTSGSATSSSSAIASGSSVEQARTAGDQQAGIKSQAEVEHSSDADGAHDQDSLHLKKAGDTSWHRASCYRDFRDTALALSGVSNELKKKKPNQKDPMEKIPPEAPIAFDFLDYMRAVRVARNIETRQAMELFLNFDADGSLRLSAGEIALLLIALECSCDLDCLVEALTLYGTWTARTEIEEGEENMFARSLRIETASPGDDHSTSSEEASAHSSGSEAGEDEHSKAAALTATLAPSSELLEAGTTGITEAKADSEAKSPATPKINPFGKLPMGGGAASVFTMAKINAKLAPRNKDASKASKGPKLDAFGRIVRPKQNRARSADAPTKHIYPKWTSYLLDPKLHTALEVFADPPPNATGGAGGNAQSSAAAASSAGAATASGAATGATTATLSKKERRTLTLRRSFSADAFEHEERRLEYLHHAPVSGPLTQKQADVRKQRLAEREDEGARPPAASMHDQLDDETPASETVALQQFDQYYALVENFVLPLGTNRSKLHRDSAITPVGHQQDVMLKLPKASRLSYASTRSKVFQKVTRWRARQQRRTAKGRGVGGGLVSTSLGNTTDEQSTTSVAAGAPAGAAAAAAPSDTSSPNKLKMGRMLLKRSSTVASSSPSTSTTNKDQQLYDDEAYSQATASEDCPVEYSDDEEEALPPELEVPFEHLLRFLGHVQTSSGFGPRMRALYEKMFLQNAKTNPRTGVTELPSRQVVEYVVAWCFAPYEHARIHRALMRETFENLSLGELLQLLRRLENVLLKDWHRAFFKAYVSRLLDSCSANAEELKAETHTTRNASELQRRRHVYHMLTRGMFQPHPRHAISNVAFLRMFYPEIEELGIPKSNVAKLLEQQSGAGAVAASAAGPADQTAGASSSSSSSANKSSNFFPEPELAQEVRTLLRECGIDREVLLKRVEVRWHDVVSYLRICRERAILKHEASAGFSQSQQRDVKLHFCGFFELDPKFTPLLASEVKALQEGKGQQTFGKSSNLLRKMESRAFADSKMVLNKDAVAAIAAKGSEADGLGGSNAVSSSPSKDLGFSGANLMFSSSPIEAAVIETSKPDEQARPEETGATPQLLFEEDILNIPLFEDKPEAEEDIADEAAEMKTRFPSQSRLLSLGLVDKGRELPPAMGRKHRRREQRKKQSSRLSSPASSRSSPLSSPFGNSDPRGVRVAGRFGLKAVSSPGTATPSVPGTTTVNSLAQVSLTKVDLSGVGSYDPYKKIDPEKELDPGLYNGTKPMLQEKPQYPEPLVQLEISAQRVKKFLAEIWPGCKQSSDNRNWLEVQMAYLRSSFGDQFGFNHALHFCKAVQEKCLREQRESASLAFIKPVDHYPGLVTLHSDAAASLRRIFLKLADQHEDDCVPFLQVKNAWIGRLPRSEQLETLINEEPYLRVKEFPGGRHTPIRLPARQDVISVWNRIAEKKVKNKDKKDAANSPTNMAGKTPKGMKGTSAQLISMNNPSSRVRNQKQARNSPMERLSGIDRLAPETVEEPPVQRLSYPGFIVLFRFLKHFHVQGVFPRKRKNADAGTNFVPSKSAHLSVLLH